MDWAQAEAWRLPLPPRMALVRQGSYVRRRSTTVEDTIPESAPG